MAEIIPTPISSENRWFRCSKCSDLLHIKYKSNNSELCVSCSGQVTPVYWYVLKALDEASQYPSEESNEAVIFPDRFNELALEITTIIGKGQQ